MLYAIGGQAGLLKIGTAICPRKRMARLATGSSVPLRLLHEIAVDAGSAADVEAMAHEMLTGRREHGEWFRVSLDEATAAIQQAVAAVSRGERARRKAVGRKMEFPDKCIAPLPEGTFARIGAVLREGEDRTSFLRQAVLSELHRREGK